MKAGNWVPISKAFAKHLPKGRAYSELEAIFSLQVDYDNGNKVTVSGYADLWGWSRNKVYSFLERLGVFIVYPNNTGKKQNQKGMLRAKRQPRDRPRTDKGQIRLIDSKWLGDKKDR